MKRDFLPAIQVRAARVAIGASSLRKQGPPGTIKAARGFLAAMSLEPFAVGQPKAFRAQLDRVTADLQVALPRGAQKWGTARKALNIFLREAMYCVYLDEAFHLRRAEQLLELPLDSITAKYLHAEARSGKLPRWPGVRNLDSKTSDAFQAVASLVASRDGLARVHLDAFWWGGNRDDTV